MISPASTVEIPCLHRVHDVLPSEGAKSIQVKLGLSISIDSLRNKLDELCHRLDANPETEAIVTFDDGHKDLLEISHLFGDYERLQPVAFLTGNQLRGNSVPLPLTALYYHCAKENIQIDQLEETFGFTRKSLKQLPESEQRKMLEARDINTCPSSECGLDRKDIESLIGEGWKIAYHGPGHSDLRNFNHATLSRLMAQDHRLLSQYGFLDWLAWPEGYWDDEIALIAKDCGFSMQFGLVNESNRGTFDWVYDRKIWK